MPVRPTQEKPLGIFLPVRGYEGLYEVSDQGIVWSVPRIVIGKDGACYRFPGRVLKPNLHKDVGYLIVSLWKEGKGTSYYLHRLTAGAHVPNPTNSPEVNHIDGNRQNNTSGNLEWVSRQENAQHAVDTGLRVYTNRLTKNEFVECLMSVLQGEQYTELSKRVPYKVPFLSTKLRSIAKDLGLESDLNEVIRAGKATRARINGAKNKR